MKKGMRVMTMFAALSFLVSVIVVSPLFAKQVTQPKGSTSTPTASQQGTVPASVAKQLPKDKFWELEVDHCVLNGASVQQVTSMEPPANCCTTTVKVGQTANITCYYRVKTPPVNSITEADVNAWGTGKSYKVAFFYPGIVTIAKEEDRTLPQFTWAEVQKWKKAGGQSNTPKIWSSSMGYTLTPVQTDVNMVKVFAFTVDVGNTIKEADENNNLFAGWFKVLP